MSIPPRPPLRLLAAVQVRPAESGQAVINRLIIGTSAAGCAWHVVDASMSDHMSDMHGISARKLLRLALLPVRIALVRLRYGADVLYYTPSGPTRAGCLKDAWVLLSTRWLFRATVLHVHAGGVGAFLRAARGPWVSAARLALRRPALLIRLSPSTPPDHLDLDARSSACLANALPDEAALLAIAPPAPRPDPPLRLLFVGLHVEAKGLGTVIDAVERLRTAGMAVELETLGSFNDPGYRAAVETRLAAPPLGGAVRLLGARFGEEKVAAFARADVLVHPTTWDNLPLVVLEAMAAARPVVATAWRGIPDMVTDGVTGRVVDVQTPDRLAASVAEAIAVLGSDPAARAAMGRAGRERFLAGFSQAAFRRAWQDVVDGLAGTLAKAT